MTNSAIAGTHEANMASLAAAPEKIVPYPGAAERSGAHVSFVQVYDEYAPFVWRAALHLGVCADAAPDVVQEIFLVVHRRLPHFERRSSIRTWIYGIALRVARHHRRTNARRHLTPQTGREELEPQVLVEDPSRRPDAQLEKAEASRRVCALLDEMDDAHREIFVLAELEEMTLAEIAQVVNSNANTVSSRLRAARRDFERAAARARAKDEWRSR